jgi:phage/plasmid primase-like uncharacterized protein
MNAAKKKGTKGPNAAAKAQVESEVSYSTLAALRGDEVGPLDHPCPVCGSERLVFRTWEVTPGMISYFCVRCETSGYARATIDQLLYPHRYAAETSAVILRVKPKAQKQYDLRRIEWLWDTATPKLPWGIIQYFHYRGIPIEEVPQTLRYQKKCPWFGKTLGCIVARYSDPMTGELRGIWRRTGDPNKPTSLGPTGGCVIRLWPQETVSNRLVIGEGIETTLAAATNITHQGELLQPAWATGCAGNMKRFPVLDGIEQLVILVDNDASGTGQKAAAECAQRWSDAGREVIRLIPPEVGTDFNDLVLRQKKGI